MSIAINECILRISYYAYIYLMLLMSHYAGIIGRSLVWNSLICFYFYLLWYAEVAGPYSKIHLLCSITEIDVRILCFYMHELLFTIILCSKKFLKRLFYKSIFMKYIVYQYVLSCDDCSIRVYRSLTTPK